jgi:SNF family Na+-dependent transporter
MEDTQYGLTGKILDFEMGHLSNDQAIDLFAELIKNGMAWTLQGSYGRSAMNLIESGYISEQGEVLSYIEEDY